MFTEKLKQSESHDHSASLYLIYLLEPDLVCIIYIEWLRTSVHILPYPNCQTASSFDVLWSCSVSVRPSSKPESIFHKEMKKCYVQKARCYLKTFLGVLKVLFCPHGASCFATDILHTNGATVQKFHMTP